MAALPCVSSESILGLEAARARLETIEDRRRPSADPTGKHHDPSAVTPPSGTGNKFRASRCASQGTRGWGTEREVKDREETLEEKEQTSPFSGFCLQVQTDQAQRMAAHPPRCVGPGGSIGSAWAPGHLLIQALTAEAHRGRLRPSSYSLEMESFAAVCGAGMKPHSSSGQHVWPHTSGQPGRCCVQLPRSVLEGAGCVAVAQLFPSCYLPPGHTGRNLEASLAQEGCPATVERRENGAWILGDRVEQSRPDSTGCSLESPNCAWLNPDCLGGLRHLQPHLILMDLSTYCLPGPHGGVGLYERIGQR